MALKQVTASKTDLFLQCPRPWQEGIETETEAPGEEAQYGTRVHLELEGKISGDSKAKDHAAGIVEALNRWCEKGNNPLGEDLAISDQERSSWVGVEPGASGLATLEAETHEYRKREIGPDKVLIWGTSDIVLEDASNRVKKVKVVLDLKTGKDWVGKFQSPAKMGQLKTLALLEGATHVGVIHAPEGGIPTIYVDSISKGDLNIHYNRLVAARRKTTRPNYAGFLRPGPECRYCPARESCPARTKDLVPLASGLVKAMTGVRLAPHVDRGKFLEGSAAMTNLLKAAREEVKEEIREGLVVENSKGKTYQIGRVQKENLSKASIIRALGEEKGTEEIERLRGLGAVETIEYEELRAK